MTIRFNAEWSPQSAVMLAWPHQNSDWHANLAAAEDVYCDLVAQITRFEAVLLIYQDADHRRHIQTLLQTQAIPTDNIRWAASATNDTWARDFGPISVTDNDQPLLLDFTFNGWGNKYQADLDNQLTRHLHRSGHFGTTAIKTIDFILEGGSIDSDGQGSLLTTRECLLTPTRNPDHTEEEITALLRSELGIERILWLSEGELAGDDTDSHIDMLARFCAVDIIAYSQCEDPNDRHYQPLQAMHHELQQLRQGNGEPYHLVALPIPAAKYNDDGQRLPGSYANFLIINGAVLVPSYNDPADNIAATRLQTCFPDREVITINCLPLIHQFGSLHCVTMQLPEGVIR